MCIELLDNVGKMGERLDTIALYRFSEMFFFSYFLLTLSQTTNFRLAQTQRACGQ